MTDDHPAHPLAAEYPLMGPAELEALADDIAANGQILPVVLWRGQVIDGRNRQAACRLRGIPCRYEEYRGGEEALPAHIASLNEHRRHLDPAFLRSRRAGRVARVAEARREGASLRQIAEAEKVSPTQVRKDVQAATVQGCTVEPADGKVTGKDGKSRPAARKPKASTVQGCTVDAGDVEAPSPAGLPVPEALRPAFAALGRFDEAAALLRQAQALIHGIAEAPGGEQLRRQLGHRVKADGPVRHYCEHVENALAKLRHARPHAPACPYCVAKGGPPGDCRACLGLGWVVKETWEQAPADYREAAAGQPEGVA